MKKKNEISIVRSSAAEYLTFLTATGQSDVNAVYADENVWLSQKKINKTRDTGQHQHPGQPFPVLINNGSRIIKIDQPHQGRKNKIYGSNQPNHPQRNGQITLQHKG